MKKNNKKPDELRGILFDFDGTLADTQKNKYIAFVETFKALNIPTEILSKIDFPLYNQLLAPYSDKEGFVKFLEYFPTTRFDIEKACIEVYEQYLKLLKKSKKLIFKGVRELIIKLNDLDIKIAIATGSTESEVKISLERVNLGNYISSIVCTADGTIPGKPHPASFILAANKLGVSILNCICVEDTPKGALSALRSGTKVICVLHSHPKEDFEHLKAEFGNRINFADKISNLKTNDIFKFFES